MTEEKLFSVAGNPILHSKSPDLFQGVFDSLSVNAAYVRLAASTASEALSLMTDMGIGGCNITSPFKEDILPLMDQVDEDAQKTGAVNTVLRDKNMFRGFNTDVEGVKNAFLQNHIPVADKTILVLGAGGAAKAAIRACTSMSGRVTVINRTHEKAIDIANRFHCNVAGIEDTGRQTERADIIISCIPSATTVFPFHGLSNKITVMDAYYGKDTNLLKIAREAGCKIIDGREWLLYQGMASMRHYTGLSPDAEKIRPVLYKTDGLSRSNISLIGFMGAGKSLIGNLLAKEMCMSLTDIDAEIESEQGTSITNIFATMGENTFRKMEEEHIVRAASRSGQIISCGGGAILSIRNREILRESSIVVWLWAGIEEIMKRIEQDLQRPVLKGTNKRSAIETLLASRKEAYAGACHLVMPTDGKSPAEIVRRLMDESSRFLKS